ncbi:CusA/CzcA family heavy metal efflux RND transporter [Methylococcus sp. ANG]|uniref:efflux RND transporter permease subunit n=1 Tax=Methylococcus sp. ANG TaxID=3231903 RepID=UPI00345946AA
MIEALLRAALKQRLVVLVVALALFGFGIDAARKLSVDAFPDVTNVQVQIAAEAPGRSPEEVERFITVPIEVAMTGLPGLTELRSLNKNGLSIVTLVFTDATDVYFARQLVMERLIEVASRMPEDVTPVLGPVSTALGEVYQYTLERPDDGQRALTYEELVERRTVQDWVVRPLLRSIPGVAEINSQGGFVKQYQVLANPDRLRHYEISLREVYESLARNNANSGGGILPHFAQQYLIRGVALISSLEDIRSIVLKEISGVPVHLGDVAEVRFGHEVRAGAIVKNGYTESVAGVVMMVRGGNAKEIVARIKARVDEINRKGMLPDGLRIVPFYDRTDLVDAALNTVTKALTEGILLVIGVLFVFMGEIRSSLIVVSTLILTPLLTFLVMNHYGISANLMTLGGLAIAIGMVVDGSVVVVENAVSQLSERRDTGESQVRIVFESTLEVGIPVIFGVGIIVLVFLPLLMLEGMEGKLFAPLALTIAIAQAISLVLGMVLAPVLSSYVLKPQAHAETRIITWIKRPYARLLHWLMPRGALVCTVMGTLLAAALALFPFLGTSFIPTLNEGTITPGVTRVPSIAFDESLRMEMEAMKLVMEVPGVKMAVSKLGRGESPADPAGPNEADPVVTLMPKSDMPDGWDKTRIEEEIRRKLDVLPGIQLVMSQPIADRLDEMVSGVRSQVAIKLFGDDLSVLKEKGDEIAKVLKDIKGTKDLRVERVTGQQYLTIDVDRAAIARHGINASDIHDIIETAVGGKKATEIYEGQRRFDAVVRYPESFRNSVERIHTIALLSPNGAVVPLDDVAHIRLQDGPAQISRETGRRRIVIGANLEDRDVGGYVAEAQQKIARMVDLPEGYSLDWGGQFENMQRAMARLGITVPITIAMIFFLLFVLFNSLRYAALILLELPFSCIGGIFGLFATGEYLSVPASVGFIALFGVAVLNGVVLVSCIIDLRTNGYSQYDACMQACMQRLRPVLMTASAALLGLIPMLFGTGPGSEIQRPLAIVVISGLVFSTALTLLVLPTVYRWFEEKRIEA